MMPDLGNARAHVVQTVSECWSQVLGRVVVDADQNFFDLGGTSLHAILLHGTLRDRLPGYEFNLVTLFEHPTINALVDALLAPGTVTEPPAARASTARPALSARRPTWAAPAPTPPMDVLERVRRQQRSFADRGSRPRPHQ